MLYTKPIVIVWGDEHDDADAEAYAELYNRQWRRYSEGQSLYWADLPVYWRLFIHNEGSRILRIEWPSKDFLDNDQHYNQIVAGKGVIYNKLLYYGGNGIASVYSREIWYPEQIWLYHPVE